MMRITGTQGGLMSLQADICVKDFELCWQFCQSGSCAKGFIRFRPLRVCALTGDQNIIAKMMAMVVWHCCSTARLKNLKSFCVTSYLAQKQYVTNFIPITRGLHLFQMSSFNNGNKKKSQSEDLNLALDHSKSDGIQRSCVQCSQFILTYSFV